MLLNFIALVQITTKGWFVRKLDRATVAPQQIRWNSNGLRQETSRSLLSTQAVGVDMPLTVCYVINCTTAEMHVRYFYNVSRWEFVYITGILSSDVSNSYTIFADVFRKFLGCSMQQLRSLAELRHENIYNNIVQSSQ